MKSAVILGFIFAATFGLVTAGEVTLSLKQIEGLKFSGSLTNATEQKIYVLPFYLMEQFYAQPNCSDCATGWVASRPMPINDAKDFIPLVSGAVIKFDAIGSPDPRLPWRITCIAVTNTIHVGDKTTPDEKSRIVIQSDEIPAKLTSH
jgi:hypothetical protein